MSEIITAIKVWFEKLYIRLFLKIPTTVFNYDLYGMNIHDYGQTDERLQKVLTGNGPYLRYRVVSDEVAENNLGRLDATLERITKIKGDYSNLKLFIILDSLSSYEPDSGDQFYNRRLYKTLNNEELHNRAYNLAYDLANHMAEKGFPDTYIESLNEPDNKGFGLGIAADEAGFFERIASHANGLARGIKAAGVCKSASPSLMSMKDDKFDLFKELWSLIKDQVDIANIHMYDEEAADYYYWGCKMAALLGDRQIAITEHGHKDHIDDIEVLRGQAWALSKSLGNQLLCVIGYVYCSDHEGWAIADDAARLWNVTHDQNPF